MVSYVKYRPKYFHIMKESMSVSSNMFPNILDPIYWKQTITLFLNFCAL